MNIPIKLILTILATVLQLIAEGMSEARAVSAVSAKYGVDENLLKRFL